MTTFPDDLPILDALHALLPEGLDSLPDDVSDALGDEQISEALSAANAHYAEAGPRDKIAALTYATLLTYRDLGGEAMGVLRKALQYHAHDIALQIAQADAMLVSGDYAAATDLLEALVSIDFREPTYWVYLGDIYLDIGEDPEARDCYRKAVDQGSDDARAVLRVARLELEMGEMETAADMFEKAGRLAPSNRDIWASVGDARLSLRQFDKAASAYERVVDLDPDDARAWTYLGMARWESGDLGPALEALRKAQRLDPMNDRHWVHIGHVELERGHFEEARQAFEKVLQRDPDHVEAVNGVVAASYDLGDAEAAETYARRAVELEPQNPDAHYNLGVVLQTLHRHDEAAETLNRAAELAPDDPRFQSARALSLLYTDSEPDDAIDMMAASDVTTAEEVNALLDFTAALFRHGGADRVREFLERLDVSHPVWKIASSAVGFIARALQDEDDSLDGVVADFVDAATSESASIPIEWDFEPLLRLGHVLSDEHRTTFETMVDILEGRKKASALEPEAA